jgi:hypothetical protein
MGCLFGIGALAIGLPALWGDASASPLAESERFDFGLIATVTGLIALIGSLITPDIRGLWYCNPERSKNARLSAKEAAINLASLKPEDVRFQHATDAKRRTTSEGGGNQMRWSYR